MNAIHIDFVNKEPGIPSIADAKGCDKTDCPGVEGFDEGFGLAGGGFGSYVYCNRCGEIRGKDLVPEED